MSKLFPLVANDTSGVATPIGSPDTIDPSVVSAVQPFARLQTGANLGALAANTYYISTRVVAQTATMPSTTGMAAGTRVGITLQGATPGAVTITCDSASSTFFSSTGPATLVWREALTPLVLEFDGIRWQSVAGWNEATNQVTTVGDLLVATATGTLARQAAGADGLLLEYDSSQSSGVRAGLDPYAALATRIRWR